MTDECRLKTSYDDDPIMYSCFISSVRWALAHQETMARYRDETGDKFEPAKNALEQMIDMASGNNLEFLQRFSDWVEINLFGTPEQTYGGEN